MSKKESVEKDKEIALNTPDEEYHSLVARAEKHQEIKRLAYIVQNPSVSESDPAITNSPSQVVSPAIKIRKPIIATHTASQAKVRAKQAVNVMKNYNIQLVALKNQKKIEELLALLRLHNYHAYIDKQGGEEIRRLFVGPYTSKAKAQSTILDLHNLTKLKGIIITE